MKKEARAQTRRSGDGNGGSRRERRRGAVGKGAAKHARLVLIGLTVSLAVGCANPTNGGGDSAGTSASFSLDELTLTVTENPAEGTEVGTVSVDLSDDSSAEATYAMDSQTVAGALAIDASTGVVTVNDATVWDYETNPSIGGTVSASIGGETATAEIAVTLTDDVAEADNGLILHLAFDGDVSDETGTGTTGTADNVVYTTDRHDNSGSAASFNGSAYAKASLALQDRDTFTIMAWIKDDGSATTDNRRIATYAGTSGEDMALRLRQLGSETWKDGSFESFVEGSGSLGTRTAEVVMPGSWIHVAVVYDGPAAAGGTAVGNNGELRVYQDGVLENTTTVPLDMQVGELTVGASLSSIGTVVQGFHGEIDDVAVFTQALSDAQVALAKDQVRTDGAVASGGTAGTGGTVDGPGSGGGGIIKAAGR